MKWKFNDHTEVRAEDTAHIVALLRDGKRLEANAEIQKLYASIKDLKVFEAFHLGHKIAEEAKHE